MPPGGHVDPDEDPVQAVLREILEETGLRTEVITVDCAIEFGTPQHLPPPYTILIEDIPARAREEAHQHIDMIYFCRPVNEPTQTAALDPSFRWVGEAELLAGTALDVAGCGVSVQVPEDVRQLALIAIEAARAQPNS